MFRSMPLVKKDFTNPPQEMGEKAIKSFIATDIRDRSNESRKANQPFLPKT